MGDLTLSEEGTLEREFEETLLQVDRDGIEDLITEIQESDFYEAPASTNYHCSYSGGLLEHSMNVYNVLADKVSVYGLGDEIDEEAVIICGLLHDFCKKGVYQLDEEEATEKQVGYLKSLLHKNSASIKDDLEDISKRRASVLIDHFKNTPSDPVPAEQEHWNYEENRPLGHGEKSVIMLQKYIDLTDEEAVAIRWHMAMYNPGIHFDYPQGYAFETAISEYPLVVLLFTADLESSYVMEGGGEE